MFFSVAVLFFSFSQASLSVFLSLSLPIDQHSSRHALLYWRETRDMLTHTNRYLDKLICHRDTLKTYAHACIYCIYFLTQAKLCVCVCVCTHTHPSKGIQALFKVQTNMNKSWCMILGCFKRQQWRDKCFAQVEGTLLWADTIHRSVFISYKDEWSKILPDVWVVSNGCIVRTGCSVSKWWGVYSNDTYSPAAYTQKHLSLPHPWFVIH